MTPREWEQCSYLLENCWRGDFDEDRAAAYFTFLRVYDAAEVEAALHAIVEEGRPFVPAVPEIVAKLREMTEEPLPSWPEVWHGLQRAMTVAARAVGEEQQRGAGWLEEHVHPVVARFFDAETYARLSQTGFFDPDYGELRIRDLRQRWEEFVGVAKERLARGLALASFTGNGQLGPRKLDQVALLRTVAPIAGELEAG